MSSTIFVLFHGLLPGDFRGNLEHGGNSCFDSHMWDNTLSIRWAAAVDSWGCRAHSDNVLLPVHFHQETA